MTSRLLTLTTALTLLVSPLVSQARELIPFLDNRCVDAIGIDDNRPRSINMPPFSGEKAYFRDVEVSPDQTRLAYVEASRRRNGWYHGTIKLGRLGRDQPIVYEGLEGVIIDCEFEQSIETVKDIDFLSLDWSPGGNLLVADGTETEPYKYSLYLIDPSSGSIKTLFSSDELNTMEPSWGPDGRIYHRDPRTGSGIFVYDLSTGEDVPFLRTDLNCELPDVSEYGIVFSSDDLTGSQDIYVGDFEGNIRGLPSCGRDVLMPQWSEDGRIIYMAENEGIYSIDSSGDYLPRKLVSFD